MIAPEQPVSEHDATEMVREAHLRMVMNAQQQGRQIPAKAVDPDIVGMDQAKAAVEASQRSMKRAVRRSFLVPDMSHIFGKRK